MFKRLIQLLATSAALFLLAPTARAADLTGPTFDVRTFGARGDGRTLDTDAINKAIDAAAAAGGGTVALPAGTYLSFSIRLKSHVALFIGSGATLVAADPGERGRYDSPERNEWNQHQDFGHSHWQNSLIWGIGLEDVSILGPGRIDGSGLTRRGPGSPWKKKSGDRPLSMGPQPDAASDPEATERQSMDGQGNKAIALKLCRNVLLRDFSLLKGGHFALLATGVNNLTIDNLKIDTNRDGLDIDACRNVRILNTSVNSPNDDAIVLKSSYALGEARVTENVTIANCHVSGYDLGTMLAGTFLRTHERAPDRDGPTGRIKLGTESSGGFRNITITNCTFDRSRGLAIEMVDGSVAEDITVSNLTMRDVTTAPIFLRLGDRGRTPGEPGVGKMRRIHISNVIAYDAEPRYASIVAGIPGHPVEDVTLSNVRIVYKGGGTKEDALTTPPEHESAYPEPSMFGTLPAYGFFVRHARGVTLRDIDVSYASEDARPPFVFEDVADARLSGIRARRVNGVPFGVLRGVTGFSLRDSAPLDDMVRETALRETLGLPTIFLVGDSTVRNGKGDGSNGQWGWGEPLAQFFDLTKVNLVNRAHGGRSSRTFITEGKWDRVLSEAKPGDSVLIQFGHNDGSELFKGNRPRGTIKGVGEETEIGVVEMTGREEVVHTFGWYLRRYVREARAKGVMPILCSPVPRKVWKDGMIVRSSESHGKWAAEVASAEGVAFLDLNSIIARKYDALGTAEVDKLFADEHTHTTAAGGELNARAVVGALKALPVCSLCGSLSAKAADVEPERP